jgi:hypothetical protein
MLDAVFEVCLALVFKVSPDLWRSAPESPAYPMVDKQQDNGPYQ